MTKPTPKQETHPAKEQPKKSGHSSFGDDSESVTPKDVEPDQATAKDTVKRNVRSRDPDEKMEAQLDDAVDMTFPASDPPAIGSITRIEPKVDDKKKK